MTWQSQIGYQNIQTLRGLSDVINLLKPAVLSPTHLALGYGLPAIWTLVTLTVEMTGPRCADYKPRFGERSAPGLQYIYCLSLLLFQNLFLLWKEGQIYLVLSSNSRDADSKFQVFQLLHWKNMEVQYKILYFL